MRRCAGADEHEVAVLSLDPHRVALAEAALEEPQRKRILEQPLDRALQRARPVGRIPAGIGDCTGRRTGDVDASRLVRPDRTATKP